MLIAPAVNLSTNAVGRITVVESHNELGATKVKGCLSLADLEELFDGSEGFIRGWEITPLHKTTSRKATKAKAPAKKAAPRPLLRSRTPNPSLSPSPNPKSFKRRHPPLPSRSQRQSLLPSRRLRQSLLPSQSQSQSPLPSRSPWWSPPRL